MKSYATVTGLVLLVLAVSLSMAQAPPAVSLAQVHRLYIEPMGGVDSKGQPMNLHEYLKTEIQKKLGKRIEIVGSREEADAVMNGTGSWSNTAGAAVTGRLMGLHDTATGAVSIEQGGAVIWSSEAGDRSIWWGALARGGPRKVASRIAGKFKSALSAADKAAARK